MKEIKKIISFYDSLDHNLVRCALLSVVYVEGSSYRRIGARMIISTDGRWVGGISGGCLEGDAQRKARIAIERQCIEIIRYDTREEEDKPIGIGLGCNGVIDVLLTPLHHSASSNPIQTLRQIIHTRRRLTLSTMLPPATVAGVLSWEENTDQSRNQVKSIITEEQGIRILKESISPTTRMIIYGDNYDVYPLIELSTVMGWEIILVGRKPKFHNQHLGRVSQVYDWAEVDSLPLDAFTACVLMSHDYVRDKTELLRLVRQDVGYIGLLGPRKRFNKMIEESGLTLLQEDSRIYNPIGLDIGAENPEEIASAIIAELIAHFRNKQSNSLRYKDGPIHV